MIAVRELRVNLPEVGELKLQLTIQTEDRHAHSKLSDHPTVLNDIATAACEAVYAYVSEQRKRAADENTNPLGGRTQW